MHDMALGLASLKSQSHCHTANPGCIDVALALQACGQLEASLSWHGLDMCEHQFSFSSPLP